MQQPAWPSPTRAQTVVGIATALCYAVGYPLALLAGSAFGWVLVTAGGVLLLALGVLTVRRIHRGDNPP